MKLSGEKFACLTSYGYCEAVAASEAGVELLLVGDSLGMVVQGHESSLPVTIEDVTYHVRCVQRGNRGAFLMADLPFMSYYSENATLENAARLMREGAQVALTPKEEPGWQSLPDFWSNEGFQSAHTWD